MSLGFCADSITYEELLSFVLIGLKKKKKKWIALFSASEQVRCILVDSTLN